MIFKILLKILWDRGDGIPDAEIAACAPEKAEIYTVPKEEWNSWGSWETFTDFLYYFLHKAWEQEQLPEYWSHAWIYSKRKKGDLGI